MEISPVFCDIDHFCWLFEPGWQARQLDLRQRHRASTLCLSEVMTIMVLFHASSYRNFKAYYTEQVMKHYAGAFPRLVSETLSEEGLQLVTKLKTKMKNRLISMFDKNMLRKRAIIESVVDQLKNISRDANTRGIVVRPTFR